MNINFNNGEKLMKKQLLSVFLAVIMCISMFFAGGANQVANAAPEGIPNILEYNSNTSASGFVISSFAGMEAFSSLAATTDFSGKTIYLACDIDMAEKEYTPFTSFAGTFDGQGHALKNLTINASLTNAGLFGSTTTTAHIKDLGIVGGTITLSADTDAQRLGSFVGQMNGGLIERCYSTAKLVAKKYASTSSSDISVGGIVGANVTNGVIKDCFFGGTATGIAHASGISDWGQGQKSGKVGKLINCLNFGKLSATTCYGLARYSSSILEENKANAITNCFYVGSYTDLDFTDQDKKVSAYRLGSGNLTYRLNENGATNVWRQGELCPELTVNQGGTYKLTISYVAAGVTTSETVYMNAGDTYTPKGVTATLTSAGNVENNVFTMPSANTSLTVTTSTPNILDYASNTSSKSFIVTTAAGFAHMATLVNGGTTLSGVSIYMLNDINMTDVANHTPIGVFISDDDHSTSFQGKLYGNGYKVLYLRVEQTELNGAGLFGAAYKATFSGIGIFGGSVKSANRAGGIAGYADKCTFINCYNTAHVTTITGKDGAGGLAGVSRKTTTFTNCFNLGTITATVDHAGGLSGWGQTNAILENCFNLGVVNATNKQALIRYDGALTTTPNASYYLPSACDTSGYGEGVSTSRFMDGSITWLLNTAGGKTENSGAFTTTPIGPALCNSNSNPAVRVTVKGVDAEGRLLEAKDFYANAGDDLGISGANKGAYATKAVKAPETDGGITVSVAAPALKTLAIGTAAELTSFAAAVNSGNTYKGYYVYLTADIDMTGATKTVIGTESAPFCGVFDGCGKKIIGFTTSSSAKYQGLFGYVKGGLVANLFLSGSTITGGWYSGTIVGKNDGGTVINCGTDSDAVGYYNKSANEISVMSFNIRVPKDASPNSLADRTPRVKQHLNDYSPDIVGFQEVTPDWKTVLDSHLSGYSKEFVWRDSKASSEAAPLYWKTSKFTVLEQGSFWLSETPDVMSLGWDAAYYRTCSYAALLHKTSGTLVLAFNTHVENAHAEAKDGGTRLIVERMKALQKKYTALGYGENIAVFCTADYNCKPGSTGYQNMASGFSDMRLIADSLGSDINQITCHGYGSSASIIDHIFLDPRGANPVYYKVCAEQINGGYISDHYTVYSRLGLEAQNVGGIVGYNSGLVSDCFTLGTVKKSLNAGGIVGYNKGIMQNCYSGTALSATDYMGGIAGEQQGTIKNSYYLANDSYGAYAGESVTTGSKNAAALKSAAMAKLLGEVWAYNASVNSGYPYLASLFELTQLVVKADSAYTRAENVLYNIGVKTSVDVLEAGFENTNLSFYDAQGNPLASTALAGTGTTVSVVIGNTVTDSATVIVKGDINGDAMHSSIDYLMLSAHIKDSSPLTGAPLLASDMDGDNQSSTTDYIVLRTTLKAS